MLLYAEKNNFRNLSGDFDDSGFFVFHYFASLSTNIILNIICAISDNFML